MQLRIDTVVLGMALIFVVASLLLRQPLLSALLHFLAKAR